MNNATKYQLQSSKLLWTNAKPYISFPICNKNYPDNSRTNKETDKQQTQGEKANSKDIVETFEDTLNHKIEQLESKLESIIESKLGEKMNTLIAFNKSIQEQCDTLNKASVSYSACVQGTSTSASTQSLRV